MCIYYIHVVTKSEWITSTHILIAIILTKKKKKKMMKKYLLLCFRFCTADLFTHFRRLHRWQQRWPVRHDAALLHRACTCVITVKRRQIQNMYATNVTIKIVYRVVIIVRNYPAVCAYRRKWVLLKLCNIRLFGHRESLWISTWNVWSEYAI